MTDEDRLLDYADLRHLGIKMTKATLRNREKAGQFPARVMVSAHHIAWRASEVRAWIAALPSGGAQQPKHLQQPQQVAA